MEYSSAVISDKEIKELCSGELPLIRDAIDFSTQLQPTGFDVTVQKITRMTGIGQIGGPYQSQVAKEEEIKANNGWYTLDAGSYLVYINEYVNIPKDLMGLAFPRSTLFRSGGMLQTGVWDGGFQGRGRLGLFVVGIDHLKIQEQCPIAQLVFFRSANVENGFQFNEFYKE